MKEIKKKQLGNILQCSWHPDKQVRLQQAEHSGTTPSLAWLVALGLMHSRGRLALLAARAHCDSRTACCQPEPPGPLPWGCSPALHSRLYTEPGLPHPSCTTQHFSALCRQRLPSNLSRLWCEASVLSRQSMLLPVQHHPQIYFIKVPDVYWSH